MSFTTATEYLAYRLADDVVIATGQGQVIAASPTRRVVIPKVDSGARVVWQQLSVGACRLRWIDDTILDTDGTDALAAFYYSALALSRSGMVQVQVSGIDSAVAATLTPASPHYQCNWVVANLDGQYRLSRFSYLRRHGDGQILESPLSHAQLVIHEPMAAVATFLFADVTTPRALLKHFPDLNESQVCALATVFLWGGFAESVATDGTLLEDRSRVLRQWDFHDLLFHCRSRLGRHSDAMGGTYRFVGEMPPEAAAKRSQWSFVQPLQKPDTAAIRAGDVGLEATMSRRVSVRSYGARPITVQQVSEFLYRVARVQAKCTIDGYGEMHSRPYPSGGASYELELYLSVDRCLGLHRGLYWYDPVNHALAFARAPNEDLEKLFMDARRSTGGGDKPQILITVAARFQRVSWKYQGIAYAIILKNVGVLYATMYNVATAMSLAPCALGLGNSDLFAKLAGTDYYRETSVGEFSLGSLPQS